MRILIVDDHGIVRDGLRLLLEKAEMEVVGEAEEGETAIEMVDERQPDVIIMDITMPKLNGIDAIRSVVRKHPDIKIVVLSMHAERHIVREVLEAGAMAYVLKSYMFNEVVRALEAVAADEHYLSSCITDVLVHDWLKVKKPKEREAFEELTSRERQILQFTAEGKSAKEMALYLHVSPKTVHGNRHVLMDKLGVSSPAELTKYAISYGLTSVEF